MQALRASLKGYALDDAQLQKLRLELDNFASGRVTLHCQEAANTILARMKDRSALPQHYQLKCYRAGPNILKLGWLWQVPGDIHARRVGAASAMGAT